MENEIYTCAICGKKHSDIESRIACETSCLKKRKEAEAKRKEYELNQKKEARYAEVEKAYQTYHNLLEAYVKDYGSFRAARNHNYPMTALSDLFEHLFDE